MSSHLRVRLGAGIPAFSPLQSARAALLSLGVAGQVYCMEQQSGKPVVHSAPRLHQSLPRSSHTRTAPARGRLWWLFGFDVRWLFGMWSGGSSLVALSLCALCRYAVCRFATLPLGSRCALARLPRVSKCAQGCLPKRVVPSTDILSRTRRLAAARAKRAVGARVRSPPARTTLWRAAARVTPRAPDRSVNGAVCHQVLGGAARPVQAHGGVRGRPRGPRRARTTTHEARLPAAALSARALRPRACQ